MSVISQRRRDCFSCKVTGSMGLIGSGCFVAYHATKLKKVPKYSILLFAATLISLGVNRFFDWPPFHKEPFTTEIGNKLNKFNSPRPIS